MDHFQYITILVSLVVGLGIADLLQSAYRLFQGHHRVRFHWLALAWAAVVFLRVTFFYWDFYRLRLDDSWAAFPAFLYLLATPVLLFLASRNALPDALPDTLPGSLGSAEGADTAKTLDLEAYYFDRPRGFFVVLALSALSQAGITFFIGISFLNLRALVFMAEVVVFAALAWSRSPRLHAAATVAVLAETVAFVFVVQPPLE